MGFAALIPSYALAGQAMMTFADTGPAMPQFKAGKLRPLVTTGCRPSHRLPEKVRKR